jgi:hypothetical protein
VARGEARDVCYLYAIYGHHFLRPGKGQLLRISMSLSSNASVYDPSLVSSNKKWACDTNVLQVSG